MALIAGDIGLTGLACWVACGLVLFALCFVLGICFYRIYLHPLSRFPGPLAAKITDLYAGYHAWKGDLHIDMWKCHEKYGDYVRYAPNRLLVNTNTGLKDIYAHTKQIQKSQNYHAMVHRAPNTLTLIDKRAHGRKRRIISQGFSDAALRSYESTIVSHIKTFCRQMIGETSITSSSSLSSADSTAWSNKQNLARWSNYLTFDIMSDVVFGEAFKLLQEPDTRFVVECIEKSNVRTGVLLQAPVVAMRRLDRYLFPEAIQGRNRFIGFVSKLLQQRMRDQEKRADVFSNLLVAKDPETQQKLSLAEIGAEATTMIVAGSDTSSTAIASTFFYLMKYPEAYSKAVEEVCSVFSDAEAITLGPELNSCTYLRACIDESLRMSPPAASALWREVINDGILVDGLRIPAGCDVGTGIYSIHHNAAYYPDPFVYRPERWLSNAEIEKSPEAVQQLHLARSAFNPFSIGPRGCIGKGLAMTELMLTMAIVLRTFDIRVGPGEENVGGGETGDVCGRHREKEFQTFDHVTAAKEGPILQFRRRQ